MLAGVYRGPGRVATEHVPVPEIADGEVLVRVAACGICGTDIKKIQHGFVAAPQIFGHEVAGTVVAVGRGVRRWHEGDRVVSFHHVPCGQCFYCDRRLFSQCAAYKKVGLTAGFDPNGGGFAEYVRAMPWIAERGMVEIPAGVSFEEATFVEPVNTCLKAVEKARVTAGETVVVMGQGPVGLLLMMLARLAGATVFTSDPMPERRAISERFGATVAFRSLRQACKRRFVRAPRAAALTLCWSPWRCPLRSPKPWRSRGRADASCCLRRTIRTSSLNFPLPRLASRKRRFLAAIAPPWTGKRSPRGWCFRERFRWLNWLPTGFRWKLLNRPCLWLRGPREVP